MVCPLFFLQNRSNATKNNSTVVTTSTAIPPPTDAPIMLLLPSSWLSWPTGVYVCKGGMSDFACLLGTIVAATLSPSGIVTPPLLQQSLGRLREAMIIDVLSHAGRLSPTIRNFGGRTFFFNSFQKTLHKSLTIYWQVSGHKNCGTCMEELLPHGRK